MTRCRIPDFLERYKIDIGMFDLKSKQILPRSVKQRDVCVYVQKIIIVLFGRRTVKIIYLTVWKRLGGISNKWKKNENDLSENSF